MYVQPRNSIPGKLKDEFNKPVESIMRCEDFKSNFARRLSNRYTSKSSVFQPKQDTELKLRPPSSGDTENVSENAIKIIEPSNLLHKTSTMEQNGEAVKPPDKPANWNSDMKSTEVTALNMEVDTLRWQLAQIEANRQMHIALLKQIVAFLNRVKDHIQRQNNETRFQKDTLPAKLLPKSFNTADLPRSRSVVQVNKNTEYSLSTSKKICTRKISKSISNVNGFKEYNSMWNQSKLSLESENETSHKISEEISRLITLANTVLSTKIPDLACSCNDTESYLKPLSEINTVDKSTVKSTTAINELEENAMNIFKEDDDLKDVKEEINNNLDISLSSLCRLDQNNSLAEVKCDERDTHSSVSTEDRSAAIINLNSKTSAEKRNNFNSSFIEDESGFSSMSSFQEIGIPIISIIPPSPNKESDFLEEIPDLIDDVDKWKSDSIELEKQTIKVFWV